MWKTDVRENSQTRESGEGGKKRGGGGRQTGRQVQKELKKETDRQKICNRRKIRVKQRGTLECKRAVCERCQ